MNFFRNTDEHLAYLKQKQEEYLASQSVLQTNEPEIKEEPITEVQIETTQTILETETPKKGRKKKK